MKAYININQKAFIELSNLKKIKLDLIDVTIFDFVYKFSISNKAQKLLIDNHLYIWCSYQKIIDDNPLMNIASKKAIEIRLNKLVEVGLLSKFTDKKQGNKTFFNVTDLAYTLVIENTNLSNEDYQPLSNEDYYNSKLNNNTYNDEPNVENPNVENPNLGKSTPIKNTNLDKNNNINYDEYLTLWNEFATKNKKSKIASLTNTRKKQLYTRLKDYKNFLEMFKYSLIKAEKSNFLLTSKFFKLDWLIKNDNNIVKVIEGAYDNGKSQEVVM